jgi:signal peptidase I
MKLLIVNFIVVFLAIAAVFFLSSASSEQQSSLPIAKNSGIFVEVTGYSMYPTIKDGETRKCEPQESYKVGDVVTFLNDGRYVSHRIVEEINGNCITKGDSNFLPDFFLVKEKNIVCKIIC